MAIFAIGDLHLSTSCNKPMDIFSGWQDYVSRITEHWRSRVTDDDTVILAGDISWGMSLSEARSDFALIDSLPGKKIILKGNHDYWWNSRKKMEDFFAAEGFSTLSILHNNAFAAEGLAIAGTRGWMFEKGAAQDAKVTAREEGRLRASLEAAKALGGEPVVFLHYPPVYGEQISGGMVSLLTEYGVRRCFYGHLHGSSCRFAIEGEYLGVNFSLISADFLGFSLKKVEETR